MNIPFFAKLTPNVADIVLIATAAKEGQCSVCVGDCVLSVVATSMVIGGFLRHVCVLFCVCAIFCVCYFLCVCCFMCVLFCVCTVLWGCRFVGVLFCGFVCFLCVCACFVLFYVCAILSVCYFVCVLFCVCVIFLCMLFCVCACFMSIFQYQAECI